MSIFDSDCVRRALADKAGPRFNACIAEAPRAMELLLEDIAAAEQENERLRALLREAESEMNDAGLLLAEVMDVADEKRTTLAYLKNRLKLWRIWARRVSDNMDEVESRINAL